MRWAVMAGCFAAAIAAVAIYGRATGFRAGQEAILYIDEETATRPGAIYHGGFPLDGEMVPTGTLVRVLDDRANTLRERRVMILEGRKNGAEMLVPLANLRHARR